MGRQTVLKLAARGAEVIALDRNRGGLAKVVAAAASAGCVIPVECDLADASSISRAFHEVGALDAAVNAAAIGHQALPLEKLDLRTIDQVIAINLRGVALCMREELGLIRMRGRGGAIVNLSSSGGLRGSAGMSIHT